MTARTIAGATLIAGTLDIASAIVLTITGGGSVAAMLRGIGSGPLGRWAFDHPQAGLLAGLAVHYGLMAIMVTIFARAARRAPILLDRPLSAGAAYGVLLYIVMYWIVIPLRWPAEPREASLSAIAVPIAIHVVLVGTPIALLLARGAARVAHRPLPRAREYR